MANVKNIIDMEKALSNPSVYFDSPEDVVRHKSLTNDQKIQIIRSWIADICALIIAEEEGMPSGKIIHIDKLRKALIELETMKALE